MKSIFIIFITTILIYSCSTDQTEKGVYYIVKHQKVEKKNEESKTNFLVEFYGNYNFMLIGNSRIFYHKKNKHYSCSSGIDLDKPFRLDLVPEDLKEIQMNDLQRFLISIPDTIISDPHFYVSISSPTDTIRNSAFKTISDFLRLRNIEVCSQRNWTEEEKYVMTAKLENRKYEPSKVDWLIGFGDTPHFSIPTDSKEEK